MYIYIYIYHIMYNINIIFDPSPLDVVQERHRWVKCKNSTKMGPQSCTQGHHKCTKRMPNGASGAKEQQPDTTRDSNRSVSSHVGTRRDPVWDLPHKRPHCDV